MPAAVAVALAIALPLLHPWPPHQPNSDLYTHLSVARHLARGEGFLTDLAYPVSFAYPFAARLPQPLLQQGPGYPLLLVPVVAATGAADRDAGPAAARGAERLVPWLHLVLLAAAGALGASAFVRRGLSAAAAPWAILLAAAPAVGLSVAWARVEIPAALLLLAAWLRWREPAAASRPAAAGAAGIAAGAADGVLAAAPALLRPDLFWVPLLWGALLARGRPGRRLVAAAAVWLALLAPWAVRNAVVTGQPFFTVQAGAEHLKETAAWPGYSIYRSLSPEPLGRTLQRDPAPILRKTARGGRFYLQGLGGLMPWGFWAGWLVLALAEARRLGRGRRAGDGFPGAPGSLRRPPVLALSTLGILALQYCPFDHDVRHLLPVLPVVLWEACLLAASGLRRVRRPAPAPAAALGAAALAAAALLLWAATPARLPGWRQAAREARTAEQPVASATAVAAALPPGPILTDAAAVAWRSGRPAVWLPLDGAVEMELRRMVPELAEAPVVPAGQL